MKLLIVGLVAAGALAGSAWAQERVKVSPMILHGEWFGTVGAMPADCADPDGINRSDGFWIVMLAGESTLSMSVQPLKAGRVTGETLTQYKYATPPAGAPARLELFLNSPKSVAAVDALNGSMLEWVPAGADGGYAQTSLYLRRCSRAQFPQ